MEQTLFYHVPASDEGERLDRFLAAQAAELSRSRVKNLIDQGLARVEGVEARPSQRLRAGQTVILIVPPVSPPDLEPDPEVIFDILYQDRDIIVVDKPPGLVVHPAAGHYSGTLVHGLLAACPDLAGIGGQARPGIVHRLDKDTSGVMVAAKTEQAHHALVQAFKSGGVKKTYAAVCRGWPSAGKGEINAPIGRHPSRRKEMSTRSRSSRSALTTWEVLRRFGLGASFLRLNIMTGRTHQIRVHLASIGCPVLGDKVYGVGLKALKKSGGPLKGLVKRQMLHARRLGLVHPVRNEFMVFEAPLPPDMTLVLETLEKAGTCRT